MIKSTSFAARDYSDFENKFNEIMSEISFIPTLAFVFLSIDLPTNKILRKFKDKNIKILGASSCGELLFDDNNEVISDGGIVVTFTDTKYDSFSTKLFDRGELGSIDFGKTIGKYVVGCYNNPSILITASGLSLDGQELVEGIQSITGNETIMFGGLAGDNAKFENTQVFNENSIFENGANVIVFNADNIHLSGLATSGWVGLGAELKVTRAKSNIVYEIDNKPALEVYKSYLNVADEDLPAMGIEYPLMIKREDNIEALRAVVGIDKDEKSLIFAGSVPLNSIVTFSSSPGFDVVNNTISELDRFYETNPIADVFILFSCMARHLALGPMIIDEISLASKKWNAPVIGFFTYGEIGTNKGKGCDFYNQTYSLVQISEK